MQPLSRHVALFPPGAVHWTFLCVVACLLLLALAGCSRSEAFQGTVFTTPRPAAIFQLQDQFGRPFSLSDHRGRVVLLTFLYTSCPDVCPIVTSQLREVHQMLGQDAGRVSFVAVSVDPERDTVEAARAYSEKWDMLDKWTYAVGSREELSPVWAAYYVDPTVDEGQEQTPEKEASPTPTRQTGVAGLREDVLKEYQVAHSTPVYLIDQQGQTRVLFTPPLDTQALVHDIRLLLDS